jgi:hypothetical protein
VLHFRFESATINTAEKDPTHSLDKNILIPNVSKPHSLSETPRLRDIVDLTELSRNLPAGRIPVEQAEEALIKAKAAFEHFGAEKLNSRDFPEEFRNQTKNLLVVYQNSVPILQKNIDLIRSMQGRKERVFITERATAILNGKGNRMIKFPPGFKIDTLENYDKSIIAHGRVKSRGGFFREEKLATVPPQTSVSVISPQGAVTSSDVIEPLAAKSKIRILHKTIGPGGTHPNTELTNFSMPPSSPSTLINVPQNGEYRLNEVLEGSGKFPKISGHLVCASCQPTKHLHEQTTRWDGLRVARDYVEVTNSKAYRNTYSPKFLDDVEDLKFYYD